MALIAGIKIATRTLEIIEKENPVHIRLFEAAQQIKTLANNETIPHIYHKVSQWLGQYEVLASDDSALQNDNMRQAKLLLNELSIHCTDIITENVKHRSLFQ